MAEANPPQTADLRALEGTVRVHRKLASSGLYLAALLVFLLPFVSVSCGAQTVLTLSGLELTFGRDLGSQFGTSPTLGITAGHLDAHLWLLLALLPPIGGLVAALAEPGLGDRARAIVLAAIGGFGLLMMLILLGDIASTNSAIQTGAGCRNQAGCVNLAAAVQVNPAAGPWLELLLDAGMLALGLVWIARWTAAPGPATPAPRQPDPSPPG